MKKFVLFIFAISLFISCRNKIPFNPKLNIVNDSDFKIDSIMVRDLILNEHMLYSINPHSKMVEYINLKGKNYRKKDGLAFEIYIFIDSMFFVTGGGIIDVPFANLENEYSFYLYNEGVGSYVNEKNILMKPFKLNKENLDLNHYFGRSWLVKENDY